MSLPRRKSSYNHANRFSNRRASELSIENNSMMGILLKRTERLAVITVYVWFASTLFTVSATQAQTSVTTQHNDIARTGANTNETILTPANVNINSFGKLFSYPVDGWMYAQPLYVAGVTLGAGSAQAGTTHNVAFVVTQHDTVYAFDADSNTGGNAVPLWQVSLIGAGETTVPSADLSCSDIVPELGISSTPVIDLATNTIYVVAKTTVGDTTFIQRLHALDLTTGQEKFGGPVILAASVPGTGSGSSSGVLKWDPKWQHNRASLLLVNGIVYIGTGSHCDNGPWHGWVLAYNASTLAPTGAWSASPNSLGSGIWGGGTGLAADVPAGNPFGRIFVATGNGTFDAVAPNYTNSMDYGDSMLKLDLNNGVPAINSNGTVVGDDFTPHNQANLNNADENALRRALLYLRRGAMWRELPDDTQWFEVDIATSDLTGVRVFPRAQWRRVSQGSFYLNDIVQEIRRGSVEEPDDEFFSKLRRLSKEDTVNRTVLLIGVNDTEPVTILDGNHRIAAAMLGDPETVLQRFRFLCGFSPRMTECCWYETNVTTLWRYAKNRMRYMPYDPEIDIGRFFQAEL